MKTMTCRDMGGPCDAKMSANTPEEMMKMGGDHVMSMKDEAHLKIAGDMQKMTPEANKEWQVAFMKKWAAAPDSM